MLVGNVAVVRLIQQMEVKPQNVPVVQMVQMVLDRLVKPAPQGVPSLPPKLIIRLKGHRLLS